MMTNLHEMFGQFSLAVNAYEIQRSARTGGVGQVAQAPATAGIALLMATVALVATSALNADTYEPTPVTMTGGFSSNLVGTMSSKVLNTEIARDVGGTTVVPGPGGGATAYRDLFTPTNGQTSYTLSHVPTDASSIEFFVNGVGYRTPVDLTFASLTITWLNSFSIATSDSVWVVYH
jgi:hypothetical protein